MNIRDHFLESVAQGMAANIAVKNGVAGALFHDEAEFIPFSDLGYNKELGYYRLSQFPDWPNECSNEPLFAVRRVTAKEGKDAYTLICSNGSSYILGERWQMAEAAAALNKALADTDSIESFDLRELADMSMADAVEYVVSRGWPRQRAERTLRSGAQYGRIPGATKDKDGYHWKFSRLGLDAWLETARPYAVESK